MSRLRPQWQQQAIAAQRRETELRRSEELQKVAQYFKSHTDTSKHHEQWTTEDYYEKVAKDAELLSEKKLKAARLEERRKKLELMLFHEDRQLQQELKELAARPKLFRNGSYLNNVPTSALQNINQGIRDKEDALRKQEAELRLHHAWRVSQPEIRAATAFSNGRRCKSAWMEQIVEKELQKKKEEAEVRKELEVRDKMLKKQILEEEERMKEKELKIRELKSSLQGQIADLSEKETLVKQLRKQEERAQMILDDLRFITCEREREHEKLMLERDTNIINMGLHKYKLKRKVAAVMREIELDLVMIERMRRAILKDAETEKEKSSSYKRVLDEAFRELEEHRERERQRQSNIEAMYDGEARQINEKQDKLWAKEKEARHRLMAEVVATLQRQVEEKLERNRLMQKENVLERERIIEDMENFNQEVRTKEREAKLQNSEYGNITTLQSQLNGLKLQRSQLEDALARDAATREACLRERTLRTEIAKAQREGAWM